MQPSSDEPDRQSNKAQKAREKAVGLYPDETWREIEPRIFIAGAREPKSNNQERDLEKELIQARLLTGLGSTVYLLPELGAIKHPDAVVDGFIMEFKTITGNADRVEDRYRSSRKKANRIFLKINSELSQEVVLRKLIDRIRKGNHSGGLVIAHFTHTGKTYFWEEDRIK